MYPTRSRWLVAVGLFVLLAATSLPHVQVWLSFPQQLRVFPGQELQFDVGPLFRVATIPWQDLSPAAPSDTGAPSDGEIGGGGEPDEYGIELRLLGLVPIQRASVYVVDPVEVVPSGEAIGILLSQQGLIVVRTAPVVTATGAEATPADDAGIRPGDILIRAGGRTLHHPVDLQSVADHHGRRNEVIELTYLRDGEELTTRLRPAEQRGPDGRTRYVVGLFLKDPAAGVGTLTFWDPRGGAYGALGHMITEGGEALALGAGRIVPAVIHGIQPGLRGRPGEKIGLFDSSAVMGNIEKNTDFGIFGHLDVEGRSQGRRPVPVALAHEVRPGPAQILTVVDGDRVEAYDVEILEVQRQSRPTDKGLVLEVTDPDLLALTNGIVQGMSGSPILQDGKLVGAVTHVFINNPRRGFGVLAEWMVYEAGLSDLAAGAAS